MGRIESQLESSTIQAVSPVDIDTGAWDRNSSRRGEADQYHAPRDKSLREAEKSLIEKRLLGALIIVGFGDSTKAKQPGDISKEPEDTSESAAGTTESAENPYGRGSSESPKEFWTKKMAQTPLDADERQAFEKLYSAMTNHDYESISKIAGSFSDRESFGRVLTHLLGTRVIDGDESFLLGWGTSPQENHGQFSYSDSNTRINLSIGR